MSEQECGGKEFFVHPTTELDQNVTIGKNTKIWHFSHIMKNTIIGANCTMGQNVVAGPDVCIGNGCKIQNNDFINLFHRFGFNVETLVQNIRVVPPKQIHKSWENYTEEELFCYRATLKFTRL